MDADGFVHLPQAPGMGYEINWEYIEENRLENNV
jgi:L-alanine-DL-glutamate epimerase-like enolase superfamily enzyme